MANKTSNLKGITIEIGGNVTPLNKALSSVNTESKNIQSQLKAVNELLKFDPSNTEAVAKKQELLTQAVGKSKEKLDFLKKAQADVEAQFKSGNMGEAEYKAFQTQVTYAEASVKKAEKAVDDFGEECSESGKNAKGAGEDSEKAGKKAKQSGEDAKSGGNGWEKFGNMAKNAGKVAVIGVTAVTTGAAVMGKKVVEQFGELEQNLGGAEAVFGEHAAALEKISETAYKTMGTSQSEYLATANKMGALFQGSGVEQKRSLELTTQAMQRATDMASVMGINTSDALEAVTGNYTMMDNLGVAMNNTTLKAYAAAKGYENAFDKMSNAEKAEVSMAYFFEQTSQYAGNFEKEATETVTGSFGLMKSALSSFVAGLGNANANISQLTQNIVEALKAVVKNVTPILKNIVDVLPSVITVLITAFADLAPQLLTVVADLLTQISNTILAALPGLISLLFNALQSVLFRLSLK